MVISCYTIHQIHIYNSLPEHTAKTAAEVEIELKGWRKLSSHTLAYKNFLFFFAMNHLLSEAIAEG